MNKKIGLRELYPLITEQLDSGGTASFAVHGTSMLPLLRDRKDQVRIKRLDEAPRKYDIIFYRRDNGDFILHRIVGVEPEGFVCRGDNQTDNEFPVMRENIIGIVTHYNTGGKWKSVGSSGQKIYSRIWVNVPILCRIRWKAESILKKKD